MRRVLAVLISVLVAGWPLLLPQPTSANPCGVTTAEKGAIFAKAGHYFDQKGDFNNVQASSAAGGEGAVGEGGYATTYNVPIAKGGTAVAAQVAVNAQDTDNKAKNYSSADGGWGGTSYAGSLNAAVPIAAQLGAGNAVGGYGDGGKGGDGGDGAAAAAAATSTSAGDGGNGGNGGNGSHDNGAGGWGGNAGNIALLPILNDASGGDGNAGNGGNGGEGGRGGDGGSAAAAAAAAAGADGGDGGNGGNGTGGDADGYAKNSASSDIYSKTTADSADGGNGGDVWNKASQNNEQEAKNDDNKAYAAGGSNTLTSTNSATGGTAGAGGAATNGSQTAGSQVKVVKDIDPVTASVSVGGASGDPCKQIIKDSTGVMAVNGVNDIKGSVMQNSNVQLGNAANTSINLGETLGNMKYGYKSEAPGLNLNINPNNNQNTNIISF